MSLFSYTVLLLSPFFWRTTTIVVATFCVYKWISDEGVEAFFFKLSFYLYHFEYCFAADPEGPGFCAMVLTGFALLLVIITLPFSLCTCIKVVAEYERSVIFRLGRLRKGKLHKIEGSHSWTKPPGGGTVCRRGCSGVAAELAELALVNQVDDVTTDQLMTTPYRNNLDNLESKIYFVKQGVPRGLVFFSSFPARTATRKWTCGRCPSTCRHKRYSPVTRSLSASMLSSTIGSPTPPWPPTTSRTTGQHKICMQSIWKQLVKH